MMQADLRRRIADRAAELAVDKVDELIDTLQTPVFLPPEELLQLQVDIEDELYRELERW